jgi:hypothetical protein
MRYAVGFGLGCMLFAASILGCSDDEPGRATPKVDAGTGGGSGSGGSSGAAGDAGDAAPPTPVVNEQTTHTDTYDDPPFQAETVTLFRTTAVLPDLDARSLLLAGGAVWAGTASGLVKLNAAGTAFETVTLPGSGAILDTAALADGRIAAARADGVVIVPTAGAPESWAVAGGGVTSVAARNNDVYVGTASGLSRVEATGATAVAAAQGFAVRDIAVNGDVIWMATASGVHRFDAAGNAPLGTLSAPASLPDDDVRAVARSSDGTEVLAATATGLSRIEADGSAAVLVKPGLDSLPNGELSSVAEAGGTVLSGHAIGATAMSATHKDHYHTERWIPAEAVTAVALADDGTRYIATAAGISRIHYEASTLAGKAAIYEPMVQLHWRMDGFVSDGRSHPDPWDHTTPPSVGDNDNDGLWTQMQIAAWCFAYSVTKDEQFYDNARKAMDTMFLLYDIPGETFAAQGDERGFVARSLVRSDEVALFESKASDDNWFLQEFQGKTYRWKNDTSSDEYAGHFFGTPIFYDLCAKDEAEKDEIRKRIKLVMNYVIDGGYELINLKGEPTTHGDWKDLGSAADGITACTAAGHSIADCLERFGGGGWLNSMEILGHLLSSWYMTGEQRFYDEYERLGTEGRYFDMVPVKDSTLTVTSRSIGNHSDHELATLAYFTLLRYEPNPDRRAIWIQSLRDMYEWEKPERNLFEIAVMASAMPDGFELAGAVQTFQEWPLDQREWLYDNSHRKDAELDAQDRHNNEQFKTMFPYDEMKAFKWNSNPYAVSGGGNGNAVQGPWPYLMPYWMMRYYGVIK